MGNAITTTVGKTPSLPRAVISAVTTSLEWDPRRALRELGTLGEHLPWFIEQAQLGLQPVDRDWLCDRLSTMQLAMTQGWSAAKATAWLSETQRLLADLPQDIVSSALDEGVKVSVKGFVPSVGLIRQFADPRVADRKRILNRLEGMLAAADRPAIEKPVAPITPTEAERDAIKAEFGLITEPYAPAAPVDRGPPRAPSPADLAAIAKEIGIDINARDDRPAANIAGLSITEIFRQRDYALGRDIPTE